MISLYLSYTKDGHNPDTSTGTPPEASQSTGAKKPVLAAEANDKWLVLYFGSRFNNMTKLISYLTSVKWLSQN